MTNWTPRIRPGKGWTYNKAELTYNSSNEPMSSLIVFYNLLGTLTSWSNQAKS